MSRDLAPFFFQNALSVQRIKDIFASTSTKIGKRDCHVIGASGLKGYVL